MVHVPWSAALDRLVADVMSSAEIPSNSTVDTRPLACFSPCVDNLKQDLRNLTPEVFREMIQGSRETPTHFKWLIYAAKDESLKVWLHEYKDFDTRLRGYTQSIHNHRYSFMSLVVAGGYRHTRYLVPPLNELDRQPPALTHDETLRPGAIYSLAPHDFHCVTRIDDGTVSLVVQSSSRDPHSVSIDEVTQKAVRHIPIEARLDILRSVIH